MPRTLARWFAILLVLALAAPAAAQSPKAERTLVVATHEAPPFATKRPDGTWSGLAIVLWRDIARDLGLKSEFRETDLADMIDGVADGRFDASVGAMTVTAPREAQIDFTHPYCTTGFGIVTDRAPPAWLSLLHNLFTWSFLQAVLALAALLAFVGLLFWWVERRANPEQFGRGWRGVFSGFWFSAVTMTTVGYGDKAPRTLPGKAIATVWMFAAILIISTFTGMIASSLTAGRLVGAIQNADDLRGAKVGSIEASAAQGWLDRNGIRFRGYPDTAAGLDAVAAGEIDAFVYDRPLLRYLVHDRYEGKLRLLPGSFGRQDYAFVLPQKSPLREPVNEALLREVFSPQWTSLVREALGADE